MNFFYDEINKLANESVGITGNIAQDQSIETNDFIYGKLNKEIEQATYKGINSTTTTTIVNNDNNSIKVEVNKEALNETFVNHKVLTNVSNSITTDLNNKTGQLDNRLDNVQNDLSTESTIRQTEVEELRAAIIGINSNYVTTNTDQHIDGIKTFYSYINIAEGAQGYPAIRSDKMFAIKPDINTSNTSEYGYYFRTKNFDPIPGSSLGSKEVPWQNAYITGDISDGLYSIKVQDIVPYSYLNNKLNIDLVQDFNLVYDNDNVQIRKLFNNPLSTFNVEQYETISLADNTHAGLMSLSDYNSLRNLESRVGNLEGKTSRVLFKDNLNPTADEINTFVLSLGKFTHPFEGVAVVVDETYHIWRYYENINNWKDDGVDTINTFTNEVAGSIKGSTLDGRVFAESDGTGSVYGWDHLVTRVINNEWTLEDTYNKLPKVYRLAGV